MNYRHAYHAGNFADVLKHAVMAWIVRYLQQKPGPLAFIDTHAGAGFYDLTGKEALKTGEAGDGIFRLVKRDDAPPQLTPYLEAVLKVNSDDLRRYPGSPLLLAALARESDRVVACELHPEDGEALRREASGLTNLRIVLGDGYCALQNLVSPPEKRGLVLVDPPFEAEGEFERLSHAFIAAHRKWPTGVYVLWYPLKSAAEVSRFHAELVNANIRKLIAVTLDVARDAPGLSATGLLICNAPFTFENEWPSVLDWLAAVLAQGPGAQGRLTRLSAD